MTDHLTMISMLVLIVVLVGASALMLMREAKLREVNARVMRAVSGDVDSAPIEGIIKYLSKLGERLRRSYSAKNLDHLRDVIQAAGFNPHRYLPIVLGGKILFMLLIPLVAGIIAFFIGSFQVRLTVVGIGVVGGIVGPDMVLNFLRRRFIADVQRGTPDALDLLVVCSEAGMGLESGLERVSEEMQRSNRSMATVLVNLLDDLRVLPNRRDAFINLGNRTGVEALRRFGTMIGQSLQYGTPLSQALRAVAGELRRERMNKLEEKAVKLPAKLIFPLILFIMPSLYIVLLGPSFMRLYDSLGVFTSALMHR